MSWAIQAVSDLFTGEQSQVSTQQMPSKPTANPYATFLNLAGYASLPPLALAIVKFNTIIHPFTLADNRHYMFYIFRYSILRAPWVRFVLVPIYLLSGVLCWKTVAGFGQDNQVVDADKNSQVHKALNQTVATKTSDTKNGRKVGNGEEKEKKREADSQRPDALHDHLSSPSSTSTLAPSLSTALLWILATTLSLFTAPLVEPRYFILPWVFWRLLLPAWSLPQAAPAPGFLKRLGQKYDLRLWVESVWFVLINVVTMYIFITRPFYWYSPDGKLADGGNVQRFMW